jgi:hypothetical protein
MHEPTEGVYEIPTEHLSVCIRWQVGHGGNGILVTLSPPSRRWRATKYCRTGELGLGHAVEFYGDGALARALDIKTHKCGETAAELSDILADCGLAVEKYCIPLLLGLNDDWPKIQKYVEEKLRKARLADKKLSLPPNVKRKWKEL